MKRKVTILSIDGGGIRGIIPAVILNYIEEGLQRKTGDNKVVLSDYFDMIAGTSTGGILACFYLLPDNLPARDAIGF
ncbi:MAG: patatin-like phospholipase family protein, partial [Prevotellaceae bacterium]|nr:patatin-like phospholipase family protein [Prevotellaceae bacterium]